MPPEGWYQDPTGRHDLRWWDGAAWTSHAYSALGEMVHDPFSQPRAPSGPASTNNAESLSTPEDRLLEPGPEARKLVAAARRFRKTGKRALSTAERTRTDILASHKISHRELLRSELERAPIAQLKEITQGRLRLGAIEDAGYRNIASLVGVGTAQLERLSGVGPHTASQVVAATARFKDTLDSTLRVRLDPGSRSASQTDLLLQLHRHRSSKAAISPVENEFREFMDELEDLLRHAARGARKARLFLSGSKRKAKAREALYQLHRSMHTEQAARLTEDADRTIKAVAPPYPDTDTLWRDYTNSAVEYNGLLAEIAGLAPDPEATHGFLPESIANKVNDQSLNTSLLKASLRGYQAFGAKFALSQGKSILGDEMGLGKTIEALAVACHLASQRHTHFLVICPASVIVNWENEIRRHTELLPHRAHGPQMSRSIKTWAADGGVAILTFEGARQLPPTDHPDISLLVVDEAHFIKNPEAKRTKAVREVIKRSQRALFLTGTPMENRVDEFQVLVDHLKPHVASQIQQSDAVVSAKQFRQVVAPVYLRRNQTDVLDELPERIEVEEWVELSQSDLTVYSAAVDSGNFMAVRRAAYDSGSPGSAKLERLLQIAEEALANNLKVVVFSFFRDVLETVHRGLEGRAMGPLTGSVPPVARQKLIDDFSASARPLVLVSQIEAGGIGLNLQAASVVILAEPQWKPSTESQAVARCHRMGQTRPVHVHRLLATETVDQHMLKILAAKTALFDAYARESQSKDASAEAVDISDLDATLTVAKQADAENAILQDERTRLGLIGAARR